MKDFNIFNRFDIFRGGRVQLPIGTIVSCTVRPTGWDVDLVIAGFTTGATYDFGSLGNTIPAIDLPKMTFTVVSEGYSASGVLGTVTRTVYGKGLGYVVISE